MSYAHAIGATRLRRLVHVDGARSAGSSISSHCWNTCASPRGIVCGGVSRRQVRGVCGGGGIAVRRGTNRERNTGHLSAVSAACAGRCAFGRGPKFCCFSPLRLYDSNPFPLRLPSKSGIDRGNENHGTKFQTQRAEPPNRPQRLTSAPQSQSLPRDSHGKHTKPESLSIEGPDSFLLLRRSATALFSTSCSARHSRQRRFPSLQEVQRDPLTDKFLHVDLQR